MPASSQTKRKQTATTAVKGVVKPVASKPVATRQQAAIKPVPKSAGKAIAANQPTTLNDSIEITPDLADLLLQQATLFQQSQQQVKRLAEIRGKQQQVAEKIQAILGKSVTGVVLAEACGLCGLHHTGDCNNG